MSLRSGFLAIAALLCAEACEVPRVAAVPRVTSVTELRSMPNVQVLRYHIEGNSLHDIHGMLRAQGPRDESGQARDAYTAWDLHWVWPRTKSGLPKLAEATVRHSTTVTLPRIGGTFRLHPGERRSIRRFLRALVAHEHRHVLNVQEAAGELRKKFETHAQRQPACSDDEAQELARQVVSRLRKRERAYDDRTAHGILQGVRLLGRRAEWDTHKDMH